MTYYHVSNGVSVNVKYIELIVIGMNKHWQTLTAVIKEKALIKQAKFGQFVTYECVKMIVMRFEQIWYLKNCQACHKLNNMFW